MEEQIRAIIKSIPDMASVDWGSRPRGAPLPGVVLNVVSDGSEHHQDGPSALSEARVQVDVYASSPGQAKILARTIRREMDGLKNGVVDGAFMEMSRDTIEEGETPGERVFRSQMDFTVFYQFS